FVARTTGLFGFFLGFSYVASVPLGWGVPGIYAGVALNYVWGLVVVGWGFAYGDWAAKASAMMDARGSGDAETAEATD
ncbi:MAG: MATE family efflux transporter, partial [Haloarculaceae archaeon]